MAFLSLGVLNRNTPNIRDALLHKPSTSSQFIYTGESLSPVWDNYDPGKLTISGDLSGINAGTYTTTFTPKFGVFWEDGTSDPYNVDWSIGKATPTASIDKSTMTLDANKTSDTITVTTNSDGAVSASSDNTGVATTSVSGKVVTVASVNDTTGSANVSIGVGAGNNYIAYPSVMSVAVTASFFPNPLNTDQLTLGQHDVYFTAYPSIMWHVDHIDGNYVYLGLYNVTERTEFGQYDSVTLYRLSTIASKCTTFLNNTIPNVADCLESVRVEGVTNKVFIPTYYQMSGQTGYGDTSGPVFTYLSGSATNRVNMINNNWGSISHRVWLSTERTSGGDVWSVGNDGSIGGLSSSYARGFRPEVKVQYKVS